jgi:hypothetical protein
MEKEFVHCEIRDRQSGTGSDFPASIWVSSLSVSLQKAPNLSPNYYSYLKDTRAKITTFEKNFLSDVGQHKREKGFRVVFSLQITETR